MMSSRLSLKETADWCRSLASSLHAGLSIVDAFRIASKRGNPRIKTISAQINADIRKGADLKEALQNRGDIYPPLFLSMAHVASHTGHLPEVLRKLEGYFRFQITLRRKFLQQIFWPAIQLVAAIFIIALLIFILGIISQVKGSQPLRIFGLTGTSGAFIWLFSWLSLFALLAFGYWASKNVLQSGAVDKMLLRVPVLGPCLEALALSRFCFALGVTMETAMSILEAIPLSLSATDNGAFTSMADPMVERIAGGASLTEVFSEYPQFPDEFIEVLSTAETSGTVPEAMERLSVQYNETAEHRLSILNTAVGWMVWLIVAGIIVFMIFQIFTATYLSQLREAQKMLDGF